MKNCDDMHPAMKERAQLVKEGHAHLSATVPGFRQKSGTEQIIATQVHVSKQK